MRIRLEVSDRAALYRSMRPRPSLPAGAIKTLLPIDASARQTAVITLGLLVAGLLTGLGGQGWYGWDVRADPSITLPDKTRIEFLGVSDDGAVICPSGRI